MTGIVVLAAGLSKRLHQPKIFFEFFGNTLLENTLSCIPKEWATHTVVVVGDENARNITENCDFSTVFNPNPDIGISSSIKLGLAALGNIDACMFIVCDQPYLSFNTVSTMLKAYNGGILRAVNGKQFGNPVIFSSEYFPALFSLSGDTGGAQIIRRLNSEVTHFDVPKIELFDVDTPNDLEKLSRIKNFFLTGEKQSGKSTIIEFCISGKKVGGFLAKKTVINGNNVVIITDVSTGQTEQIAEILFSGIIVNEKIFETLGVQSLKTEKQIIVMDELGRFEGKCEQFKSAVYAALNSETPVFGVLQEYENPWFSDISRRDDTAIIRVGEGREQVLKRLKYVIDSLQAIGSNPNSKLNETT